MRLIANWNWIEMFLGVLRPSIGDRALFGCGLTGEGMISRSVGSGSRIFVSLLCLHVSVQIIGVHGFF